MADRRIVERLSLPAMTMGTVREVVVHRFGDSGARPKVYLQAGIHGNEHAGMLVLHHLITRLDKSAAEGRLRGELIVIPVVNPIGISQFLNNELLGRFDFFGKGNFNRKFPDLSGAVAKRVAGNLGDDPGENLKIVRQALRDEFENLEASNDSDALRVLIAGLAADADVALDLHCDGESLLHMYTCDENWPWARELAAQMGISVVLLGTDRAAASFDDALNLFWTDLAERLKTRSIPRGCFAAAVELRGRADVDDRLAASDAENLYKFLMRRGAVDGEPGPLPETAPLKGMPLSGLEQGTAPVAGVAVFKKNLGDFVKAGEVVADVIDVSATDPYSARHPVQSRTDGILFSMDLVKMVRPGSPFFKVAGTKPLENNRKSYLED
jgi:predicted deacylase